ncbi:MAG: cobalamin biosynthesis protein CobD [Chloroflexi bacterium]|nr:cobalamin biosynthesis protein CobD [Chloroflexota bacterium]
MLAIGLAVDLALGEPPPAIHPVVWAGKLGLALERLAPKRGAGRQLLYGGGMVFSSVAIFGVGAWLLLRLLASWSPWAGLLVGGLLLKTTFAVRGLEGAARRVRDPLMAGDLGAARRELRSLVSRDASQLGSGLVAAAAVESLAENTNDSFVAPLFFYALLGVPGALGYRVLNTFDSMIGYRGHYEYLGKAAARLDDLANLIPARFTGLLIVLAAPLAGGCLGRAWRLLYHEHAITESPNAGWSMAAMAGAVGVRLEKVGHYVIGERLPAPAASAIDRAIRLMRRAVVLAIALYIAVEVPFGVYLA